ncbi:hypothetical protein CNQ87_06115 [Lysinibacillus fusiformis]|nr:hypothetical protein CNQ87_06115 [Lysinibacillus fusiformis]
MQIGKKTNNSYRGLQGGTLIERGTNCLKLSVTQLLNKLHESNQRNNYSISGFSHAQNKIIERYGFL